VSSRLQSLPASISSPEAGRSSGATLLISSYDWERDRESITLGDAGVAVEVYRGIGIELPLATALREEWKEFDVRR